ncbi:MAG: sigma-54-dependent Fis family transcriptional regulator [Deltaproteobacteria bacterium]|nr:MAG: sigma-54-dependent Fis family transcriptional regulator [Deltaproteobacteria bacterium]
MLVIPPPTLCAHENAVTVDQRGRIDKAGRRREMLGAGTGEGSMDTTIASTQRSPVLLTWLATRNDPYERDKSGGAFKEPRVWGPTLTLMADPESPYKGRIDDVVVFRQAGPKAADHTRVYEELVAALEEHEMAPRLHPVLWDHDDPTDHAAIYDFLRTEVPRIRRQFRDRELVIHLSPGTASMHTVWVLMCETGFISQPFTAVQSLRPGERRGRAPVNALRLGVDTFFKRWQETKPAAARLDDHQSLWDPSQFRSTKMRALYDEARRAARLKIPVLILGERGTGKTTLASWIRLKSPFRKSALDSAWPAVPCGQYTNETMRAELFGYRKGAFTGATTHKAGLLAEASGDTLFLDEIGDVSKDLQRLLIKVLEDGTFQPVGSTKVERTDVRLLTATNLPDNELRGRLDADFLDRISAFTLTVPPLREIPDELEWLWPNVLDEAARRAAAPTRYAQLPKRHHARFVSALQRHPLPGNIRDLFRVAWRFLAARADDDAPLNVEDAVDYALAAIDRDAAPDGSSRTIARAFADMEPLPPSLVAETPLDPNRVIDDFKAWFAAEARALGQRTGQPLGDLVTVTDRTLRNWRKDDSEAPE